MSSTNNCPVASATPPGTRPIFEPKPNVMSLAVTLGPQCAKRRRGALNKPEIETPLTPGLVEILKPNGMPGDLVRVTVRIACSLFPEPYSRTNYKRGWYQSDCVSIVRCLVVLTPGIPTDSKLTSSVNAVATTSVMTSPLERIIDTISSCFELSTLEPLTCSHKYNNDSARQSRGIIKC
jgi:hypothetical protein